MQNQLEKYFRCSSPLKRLFACLISEHDCAINSKGMRRLNPWLGLRQEILNGENLPINLFN